MEDKRAGGHKEIKTILVILIRKPRWKGRKLWSEVGHLR